MNRGWKLGKQKPKEKKKILSTDLDILTSRLQVVLTKKREVQNEGETNWTLHDSEPGRETHTCKLCVVNPTKFMTIVSKGQGLTVKKKMYFFIMDQKSWLFQLVIGTRKFT